MQDPFPIPSCFSSGEKQTDDPNTTAATKSGQSVAISVYRTKIAGHCRLITITWCKDLLAHGLSVSIEGSDKDSETNNQYTCKVELRPWNFWRKNGSKRFLVEGKPVDVFWDLKGAKFYSEPEPLSDYYVAVVFDDEVVLLLGDQKNEAFKKTRSPPSIIDAILVSKKEHVFGKRKFSTRAKFHEKGKFHDIAIECGKDRSLISDVDPEMVVKIDGLVAFHVKHLQWKFRGNESISINRVRVEVYWDVHDWLFGPGLRHALFIFKPILLPSSSSSASPVFSDGSNVNGSGSGGSSGFTLFLYAWRLE